MKNWMIGLALVGLFVLACANEAGDDVECPVCDETTEALVGTQCVPLADVEECGPDGHVHGGVCHCFGNQAVTEIDGMRYCLQETCGVISDKVEADESPAHDEHEGHEHDEHEEEGDEV